MVTPMALKTNQKQRFTSNNIEKLSGISRLSRRTYLSNKKIDDLTNKKIDDLSNKKIDESVWNPKFNYDDEDRPSLIAVNFETDSEKPDKILKKVVLPLPFNPTMPCVRCSSKLIVIFCKTGFSL